MRRLLIDRPDHWIIELFRSVIVSLSAAIGDYSLLILLVELAQAPVVVTSMAGVVFGHLISYLLHTLWIFPGHEHGYHKTQMVLFIAVGASGLLLHSGLMYLFTRHTSLHYILAKTASVFTMFVWGFVLRRTSHRLLTNRRSEI